jgi:hypothetical protein
MHIAMDNNPGKPGIKRCREGFEIIHWPRDDMVMRGSLRAGFCLLILLATWSVAGGIAATQMEQGNLRQAHRLPSVSFTGSRLATHSSHPIADDGLTHCAAQLQTVAVLPFFVSLLTFTRPAIPGPEKDLLNLTQRRRE